MSQITKLWDGSILPDIETLTGDTGGPVGPTGGNINILGGGSITVDGNPMTSTLTVTSNAGTEAFSADISDSILNATGDGTSYNIVFDRTYFDIGSNFDTSTGGFTAPAAGFYQFNCSITLANLNINMVEAIASFNILHPDTTQNNWSFQRNNPYVIADGSIGLARMGGSCMLQLITGDIVSVRVLVRTSTKTTTISYGSIPLTVQPATTWFNGYRIS